MAGTGDLLGPYIRAKAAGRPRNTSHIRFYMEPQPDPAVTLP